MIHRNLKVTSLLSPPHPRNEEVIAAHVRGAETLEIASLIYFVDHHHHKAVRIRIHFSSRLCNLCPCSFSRFFNITCTQKVNIPYMEHMGQEQKPNPTDLLLNRICRVLLLSPINSWNKANYQVIQNDLFGMIKWPLERLSDLQLGNKKVILNHLVYIPK